MGAPLHPGRGGESFLVGETAMGGCSVELLGAVALASPLGRVDLVPEVGGGYGEPLEAEGTRLLGDPVTGLLRPGEQCAQEDDD